MANISPLQPGANNAVKLPSAYGLNSLAASRVAALATILGKGLPCKVAEVLLGPLVTVEFQVHSIFNLPKTITVPVSGTFQYDRIPIQVGDTGHVRPTGASLFNITGRSTVIPQIDLEGNLGTLSFEPLSGPNWPNLGLPGNARIIYGHDGAGVILQDSATGVSTSVTVNRTGGVVLKQGSLTLTVNSGVVSVTAGGTLSAVMTQAGASPVLFADG